MKYSINELKSQKLGFIFSAERFLKTILPTFWNEKRLVSANNNVVEETNLMGQTLANMKAMGLSNTKDVKETLRNFVCKYGTGLTNSDKSTKLPAGQKSLHNRVENDILYQHATKINNENVGRHFIWLPSNSKDPRDEHMLRYGKVFEVGNNNLPEDDCFPGMAYGCKCGYQWVDMPVSAYKQIDETMVGKPKMDALRITYENYLNKAIKISSSVIITHNQSNPLYNQFFNGIQSLSNSISSDKDFKRIMTSQNRNISGLINAINNTSPKHTLGLDKLDVRYFPIPKAITLHKVITDGPLSKATVGNLYKTTSALTMSIANETKKVKTILHISVPKNTPSIPAFMISKNPLALEIILAPNRNLQIRKVEVIDGVKHVYGNLLSTVTKKQLKMMKYLTA